MTLAVFYILLRATHFISLISMTGSAFFTAWLAPRSARPSLALRLQPLLTLSCVINVLSALALLAVQAGLMSGDWHHLANLTIWQAVLNTGFGQVWRWELLFALLACGALWLAGAWRQRGLLLCGLLQLAALALTGHAAMHHGLPGAAQRINQVVHLTSAAFWAGGLWPMLVLMGMTKADSLRCAAIATMMRFSRYGHLAVALVILSGIFNSLLISEGAWPGWVPYYQLLLIKVLLVALMVIVALVNRYILVPKFNGQGADAARRFVVLTRCELIFALLVVALVSLFATLSPV